MTGVSVVSISKVRVIGVLEKEPPLTRKLTPGDGDHDTALRFLVSRPRVGLLPEGLLAAAEEVGEQRGNAVGERVGFEIVVERVVAVGAIEAELDVVVFAAVLAEDLADATTEVAFDFEDEPADALLVVIAPIGR